MNATKTNRKPLLDIEDLSVEFKVAGGLVPWKRRVLRAVNGVTLSVHAGETLGIVGESGSGKSTLGRAVLRLGELTAGKVLFEGTDMAKATPSDLARLRRATAMIFQDPYNALNPRLTVGEAIGEVLRVHRKVPAGDVKARVSELLQMVGLAPELAARKPSGLSGGQCQRIGIARALAVEPRLIIADECVAALDVSVQGQIINLLIELRERMGVALIFIAHDLALVRRLCDRVAVMYLGRVVEEGPTAEVFAAPRHPYTASLLRAIPEIDPDRPLSSELLPGDPPSPLNLPRGCAFHPRCALAEARCAEDPPPPLRRRGDHLSACLLDNPT
ncbi:ABC transporter ATP-binding protein [Radicibacter daui]|uniref:ABC transporter ATP-binding protein n=1 Tax=Radicibacter daui TaxID=3064829 RepID=UPI004046C022